MGNDLSGPIARKLIHLMLACAVAACSRNVDLIRYCSSDLPELIVMNNEPFVFHSPAHHNGQRFISIITITLFTPSPLVIYPLTLTYLHSRAMLNSPSHNLTLE